MVVKIRKTADTITVTTIPHHLLFISIYIIHIVLSE